MKNFQFPKQFPCFSGVLGTSSPHSQTVIRKLNANEQRISAKASAPSTKNSSPQKRTVLDELALQRDGIVSQ